MGKNNKWIFLFFVGICFVFFYPIFFGKIPFPADLLISEYSPWKYMSFLGYASGAYPEKFQYFDVLRQMYPWTTFVIHTIQSLQFPLWNPYNFSGTPLFANSQSAVLYPFHLLYFLLPQVGAWTLLVMLQPGLASIGTYLYGRKIGLGKWGSTLAGIAFGYCLFFSVFLEYNTIDQVVLFLPFLLWLIELTLERKKFWIPILLPLTLAASFFAGHIQIFGFLFLFLAVYILIRSFSYENKQKNILWFGLLLILGFGIAAVQLLPTLELIQNAARSSQEYAFLIHNLLLQPYQALLFLSPDLFGNPASRNYLFSDSYPGNAVYIGFIPFVFSLYSLFLWKHKRQVVFYAVSSVFFILFFFNTPATELFYKLHIPLFSTGSPTNALFLLSFSLSILAGFGFDRWMEKKEKRIILLAVGLCVVFLLGVVVLRLAHIPFIAKSVIYTSGISFGMILLLFGGVLLNKRQIVGIMLIGITLFDLLYFFQKFNPFVPQSLIFPQSAILTYLKNHEGINRFLSYGNGYIQPNIATQYQLYDPNGYDPLYPKWYGAFIESAKSGNIPTQFSNQNRSDAVLDQAYTSTDLVTNNSSQKAMNLLGVRYVVGKDDPTTYKLSQNQFGLVFQSNGWQVYENKIALPRVFLAYNSLVYSSDKDFGNKFYSDVFNPRTTILLDRFVGNFTQGTGSAVIKSYTASKVVIHTASTAKALLFLSDTYYPGWNVTIDGKESTLLKADYAFRAVVVPAGSHTVIFSYTPSSFSLGLTLTIISLGIVFLIGMKEKRQYE